MNLMQLLINAIHWLTRASLMSGEELGGFQVRPGGLLVQDVAAQSSEMAQLVLNLDLGVPTYCCQAEQDKDHDQDQD